MTTYYTRYIPHPDWAARGVADEEAMALFVFGRDPDLHTIDYFHMPPYTGRRGDEVVRTQVDHWLVVTSDESVVWTLLDKDRRYRRINDQQVEYGEPDWWIVANLSDTPLSAADCTALAAIVGKPVQARQIPLTTADPLDISRTVHRHLGQESLSGWDRPELVLLPHPYPLRHTLLLLEYLHASHIVTRRQERLWVEKVAVFNDDGNFNLEIHEM